MTGSRSVAGAPSNLCLGYVRLLPYYGGTFDVSLMSFNINVSGNAESLVVTNYGYMAYGDTVQMLTADFSTGGTVLWNLALKGTEFIY